MGIFDDVQRDVKAVEKDKQEIQKIKGYADLNKDGKVDKQDLDKAKQYEADAKNIAGKFGKKS